MRSKQAAKNMIANVMLQMVVLVSGIVLPRFFLMEYGSTVNGMVNSINQFLVYLGLAEAGVGTASVVALYGPLAREDQKEVNGILSATRRFYYRSGSLFAALVAVFAFLYPYLITQQLSAGLVRTMVVILASSMLVDYLILGQYKVLLTANQQGYVVAYVQAAGTLLNMGVSMLLITLHADVLVVKGAATLIYILRFLVVRRYVKTHFADVDYRAEPKMDGLKQRGAALLHQVVGVIVNNTDSVLLTVCMGARSLKEVSVYSVYNMVIMAISQMFNSFSNGLTAGFGEVISRGETEVLKKSFSSYEYIYMMVVFCVTACTGVLLLPFVMIYTLGVTDAVYVRPVSAALFTLIVLFQNIRVPGLTIISAAGHFRQTQHQAVLEAVINLAVSLSMVWKFGMNGVLAGTVCSYAYRSIDIILYNRKYLVPGSGKKTLGRITRNLAVSLIVMAVAFRFVPHEMDSFVTWTFYAILMGVLAVGCLVAVNFFCEPDEFRSMWERFGNLRGKKL